MHIFKSLIHNLTSQHLNSCEFLLKLYFFQIKVIASNTQDSLQISLGVLATLVVGHCRPSGRESLLGLCGAGIPQNHLIIHNAQPGRKVAF